MSLNIVHFSKTPLAGAPIRLVNALREHTNSNVRLIDLHRYTTNDGFGYDVVFAENPDLALSLAKDADIIHLHNYLDLTSEDFSPLDFHELKKSGVQFVRHFHSHPQLIAAVMGRPLRDVLEDDIPSIVIAQFQERYYPNSRVVPNVIPQDHANYLPLEGDPDWDLFFNPTTFAGTWDDRWNTKGNSDLHAILKQVSHKEDCRFKYMFQEPLAEVLSAKQRSRIIVDELVTGSYHLSGLEGLSMGRAVFSYLDPRTEFVLREISGANALPFVNVRMEEAKAPLEYFLSHPDEADDLGRASRSWFETYYSASALVQHYEQVYVDLMDNCRKLDRQKSLDFDNSMHKIGAFVLPDLIYETRKRRRLLCSLKFSALIEYVSTIGTIFVKLTRWINQKKGF